MKVKADLTCEADGFERVSIQQNPDKSFLRICFMSKQCTQIILLTYLRLPSRYHTLKMKKEFKLNRHLT